MDIEGIKAIIGELDMLKTKLQAAIGEATEEEPGDMEEELPEAPETETEEMLPPVKPGSEPMPQEKGKDKMGLMIALLGKKKKA